MTAFVALLTSTPVLSALLALIPTSLMAVVAKYRTEITTRFSALGLAVLFLALALALFFVVGPLIHVLLYVIVLAALIDLAYQGYLYYEKSHVTSAPIQSVVASVPQTPTK